MFARFVAMHAVEMRCDGIISKYEGSLIKLPKLFFIPTVKDFL